jgi:glycosyltransferase involved in cell wall biosynthesis
LRGLQTGEGPLFELCINAFREGNSILGDQKIADLGVKIKAFESKTPFIPRYMLGHLNVDFLGRVSTGELVDLYSNALFTLFPFTHEPFGYIPPERMACGTPVVTYNSQGPYEYVTRNRTDLLVNTDEELVQKSMQVWKAGYPSRMRISCVEEASKFDKKIYVQKWMKALNKVAETCLIDRTGLLLLNENWVISQSL